MTTTVADPYDMNAMLAVRRDPRELEAFLIFSVCVAGHSAKSTRNGIEKFLKRLSTYVDTSGEYLRDDQRSPMCDIYFAQRHIQEEGIAKMLKESGIGCYNARAQTLCELAESILVWDLNIATCAPQELEDIYGIGPKTARFFILYSRPEVDNLAVLDVHTLRWLATQGYNVPKSTPAGKSYERWERTFINEAMARGMHVRDFDFAVWSEGAAK